MFVKIFIANVTPAGDAHLAVHHKGFVVHAPVDAVEVGNQRQPAPHPAAGTGRVEDTHPDVGVCCHGGKQRLLASHVDVVQQQAYLNATVCSGYQPAGQVAPGGIVIPDVILGINKLVGGFDQRSPHQEGITATVQQLKAGVRGVWGKVHPALVRYEGILHRG